MTDALNSLPETRRRILEQIKRGGNTTADAVAADYRNCVGHVVVLRRAAKWAVSTHHYRGRPDQTPESARPSCASI